MANGLKALGVEVRECADGMDISGGEIGGGVVESLHDHRISMSFLVAGAIATAPVKVFACDNIATSFPTFVALATKAGMSIDHD